jgi:hypothetical protein
LFFENSSLKRIFDEVVKNPEHFLSLDGRGHAL